MKFLSIFLWVFISINIIIGSPLPENHHKIQKRNIFGANSSLSFIPDLLSLLGSGSNSDPSESSGGIGNIQTLIPLIGPITTAIINGIKIGLLNSSAILNVPVSLVKVIPVIPQPALYEIRPIVYGENGNDAIKNQSKLEEKDMNEDSSIVRPAEIIEPYMPVHSTTPSQEENSIDSSSKRIKRAEPIVMETKKSLPENHKEKDTKRLEDLGITIREIHNNFMEILQAQSSTENGEKLSIPMEEDLQMSSQSETKSIGKAEITPSNNEEPTGKVEEQMAKMEPIDLGITIKEVHKNLEPIRTKEAGPSLQKTEENVSPMEPITEPIKTDQQGSIGSQKSNVTSMEPDESSRQARIEKTLEPSLVQQKISPMNPNGEIKELRGTKLEPTKSNVMDNKPVKNMDISMEEEPFMSKLVPEELESNISPIEATAMSSKNDKMVLEQMELMEKDSNMPMKPPIIMEPKLSLSKDSSTPMKSTAQEDTHLEAKETPNLDHNTFGPIVSSLEVELSQNVDNLTGTSMETEEKPLNLEPNEKESNTEMEPIIPEAKALEAETPIKSNEIHIKPTDTISLDIMENKKKPLDLGEPDFYEVKPSEENSSESAKAEKIEPLEKEIDLEGTQSGEVEQKMNPSLEPNGSVEVNDQGPLELSSVRSLSGTEENYFEPNLMQANGSMETDMRQPSMNSVPVIMMVSAMEKKGNLSNIPDLNRTEQSTNGSRTFVVQKDARNLFFHIQENPGDFMVQIEEIPNSLMDHLQEDFDKLEINLIPNKIVEQMDKVHPNMTLVIVLPKPLKAQNPNSNVSIDENYSQVTLTGGRKIRQAPFWGFLSYFTTPPEPYNLRPIIFNVPSEQKMSTINILQSLSNILGENSDTISALTTFNVTQDENDDNFQRSSHQRGFYKESVTNGEKDGQVFKEQTRHFAQENVEQILDNSVRFRRKRQISEDSLSLPGNLGLPSSNSLPVGLNSVPGFDTSNLEQGLEQKFDSGLPNLGLPSLNSLPEGNSLPVSGLNSELPNSGLGALNLGDLGQGFESRLPNLKSLPGGNNLPVSGLNSGLPNFNSVPNENRRSFGLSTSFDSSLPNPGLLSSGLPNPDLPNSGSPNLSPLPVTNNLPISGLNSGTSNFNSVSNEHTGFSGFDGSNLGGLDQNFFNSGLPNLSPSNPGLNLNFNALDTEKFTFNLQKALEEENSFKNVFEQAFPNREHSGEEYQKEETSGNPKSQIDDSTANKFAFDLQKALEEENNFKNVFEQSFPNREHSGEEYQSFDSQENSFGNHFPVQNNNFISNGEPAFNVLEQNLPLKEPSNEIYQESSVSSLPIFPNLGTVSPISEPMVTQSGFDNIFEQAFPKREHTGEIYQTGELNINTDFQRSLAENSGSNFDLRKALEEENSFKNVFEQAFPNREHSGDEYQKENTFGGINLDSGASKFKDSTTDKFSFDLKKTLQEENSFKNVFEQAFPNREHSGAEYQKEDTSGNKIDDSTTDKFAFDLQKALEEDNSFRNVFEQAFPNKEHSGEEYQKTEDFSGDFDFSSGSPQVNPGNFLSSNFGVSYSNFGSLDLSSRSGSNPNPISITTQAPLLDFSFSGQNLGRNGPKPNFNEDDTEKFAFNLQKALKEENSFKNVFEQAFPNREHSGEEYQKEDTSGSFNSGSGASKIDDSTTDKFAFDLQKALEEENSFKNVFEQAFPNKEHSGEEYQTSGDTTFNKEVFPDANNRDSRFLQNSGFPNSNDLFQNELSEININITLTNGNEVLKVLEQMIPIKEPTGEIFQENQNPGNQDQQISVQTTFEQIVPNSGLNIGLGTKKITSGTPIPIVGTSQINDKTTEKFAFNLQKALQEENNFNNVFEQAFPNREHSGEEYQKEDTSGNSNSDSGVSIIDDSTTNEFAFDLQKALEEENSFKNVFEQAFPNREHSGEEYQSVETSGNNDSTFNNFGSTQNSNFDSNPSSSLNQNFFPGGSQGLGSTISQNFNSVGSQNLGTIGAQNTGLPFGTNFGNSDQQNSNFDSSLNQIKNQNQLPVSNLGDFGSQNLGSGFQNLGFRNFDNSATLIQQNSNFGSSFNQIKNQNPLVSNLGDFGSQNLGSGFQNLGIRSQNLGSGSQNFDSGSQKFDSSTQNLGSVTQNLGSGTQNLGSGTQNVDTGFQNLGLRSQNLGSGSQNFDSNSQNFDSASQKFDSGTQNLGSASQNLNTPTKPIPSFISEPQKVQNATLDGFLFVVPNLKDPIDFESKEFTKIQTNVALSPISLLIKNEDEISSTVKSIEETLPRFDEIPLEQHFFDRSSLRNSYGEKVVDQRK